MGDADITLRHIVRRHAAGLARPYLPPDSPVQIVGWADTQVTALERRLDKTLLLRLAGELHMLVVELAYRHDVDLAERVHEYQCLSRIAMRAERPGEEPPPIESVVILLTGRSRRWPLEQILRTGWPGRRFSGTCFRLDAVYQRTVSELFARASPFWLVFTPLARDADADALHRVVDSIRSCTPDGEERWELFAALLVMADIDTWGHNLYLEVERMIDQEPKDLIQASRILRTAYERGRREGLDEGQREGLERGQREGLERGQREGLERGIERMLLNLFATRMHRALTEPERRAVAEHAARDPERSQERALTLEGEALADWLLHPDTISAKRENGAKARKPAPRSSTRPRE